MSKLSPPSSRGEVPGRWVIFDGERVRGEYLIHRPAEEGVLEAADGPDPTHKLLLDHLGARQVTVEQPPRMTAPQTEPLRVAPDIARA